MSPTCRGPAAGPRRPVPNRRGPGVSWHGRDFGLPWGILRSRGARSAWRARTGVVGRGGGRARRQRKAGPRAGRTMVQIKLPDGSVKEFPEGVRPREVAEGIGKRLAEAAVAAVADGTVVDLDRPLEDGDAAADRAADPDGQGPRGARRPAALDRAHHGPGDPAALPRRPARLRPDHRHRLLLRRRLPATAALRGRLPGDRGRDGQDHQGGRAVRAVRPARPRGPPVLRGPRPGATRSSTSTTSCTSTAS